jgi:hypothetical protein
VLIRPRCGAAQLEAVGGRSGGGVGIRRLCAFLVRRSHGAVGWRQRRAKPQKLKDRGARSGVGGRRPDGGQWEGRSVSGREEEQPAVRQLAIESAAPDPV